MQDGEKISPYMHRGSGYFPVIGETILHYHILLGATVTGASFTGNVFCFRRLRNVIA